MPIYEYECAKCGHKKEVLQRFSDSPLTECELCHGRMKKLISHSTFHLKGSGWYVTDYASKSGGNQGFTKKPEKTTTGSETKGTATAENSSKTTSSDN